MLDEFDGSGGVLVIFGVTIEADVLVVVCYKDSSLPPSDRPTLVVLN